MEEGVVVEEEAEEAGVEAEEVVAVVEDVVTEEEGQAGVVEAGEEATTGTILSCLLYVHLYPCNNNFIILRFVVDFALFPKFVNFCTVCLLQTRHETGAKRSPILMSPLIHLDTNKPFRSKHLVYLLMLSDKNFL